MFLMFWSIDANRVYECIFVGYCATIASFPFGNVSYDRNPDDNGFYPRETIATFTCEDGYSLHSGGYSIDGTGYPLDDEHNTYTCRSWRGSWSPHVTPTPTCDGNKIQEKSVQPQILKE